MIVKMDAAGNININGEASATPQYAVMLFLYLMARNSGVPLEYDPASDLHDFAYDEEHDLLTWTAWGSEQSYSFNSPTLVRFIEEAASSISPQDEPTVLISEVESALIEMCANAAQGHASLLKALNGLAADMEAFGPTVATVERQKKLASSLNTAIKLIQEQERVLSSVSKKTTGFGAANAAIGALDLLTK